MRTPVPWSQLLLLICAVALLAPLLTGEEDLRLLARDADGHGLLCTTQKKTILFLAGTPEQMGTAHGRLLKAQVGQTMARYYYLVGGGFSVAKDKWFVTHLEEVERRAAPHTPKRFVTECEALARSAGLPAKTLRLANIVPEQFHCSGVAVRGKASKGGAVVHARVLDYMTEIGLQKFAVLSVHMPEGRNAWTNVGYAGFVGTVTAMNEKGLAIGEMGGRGQGDWDGTPMTYLLRDIMERAGTVDEALAILKDAKRTCEYYYVLSDKSRNLAAVRCTAREMEVLKPGQQHELLPPVPEDTVFVSGDKRAKKLSERLTQMHGKVDAKAMMQIIKRPVAMKSNLHNAIFMPETLELWFADAGRHSPACDEPYAHVKLDTLIDFYRKNISPPPDKPATE